MRSTEIPRPIIPHLSASKRFKGYKGEKGSIVRGHDRQEGEGFLSIITAWMKMVDFPSMPQMFHDTSNPSWYAREALAGVEYEAEDVTRFSIAVGAFQDMEIFEAAGRFLSMLVQLGKEDRYLISTAGMSYPLNVLGYRNSKSLEIDGDVGMWLGLEMSGGTILARGDAGDSAGSRMSDGLIIIEGDSGPNAGSRLLGGKVLVKGNAGCGLGSGMGKGIIDVLGDAGDDAGNQMRGGEIEIHGSAGHSAGDRMEGGRITIHGDAGDFLGGHETFGGQLHPSLFLPLYDSLQRTWRLYRRTGVMPRPPPQPQRSGEIIVMGNAGEAVGQNMAGGTIRIHGKFKSLGSNIKGRIYQGDRLIFSDDG